MGIAETTYQGPVITKASKALILLHGRGGSSRDILKLAQSLGDEKFYIAAPQAVNNSWYPYGFMADEKLNEPDLSLSIESIKKLIDETSNYIPLERIYIVGFSQGACLALEISSRFAAKYGGVIAFTGGLIGPAIDEKKFQGNFAGTKVFISNGDQDPHVPLLRSQQSKDVMEKLGADVNLKVYQRDIHWIDKDEILSAKQHLKF